MRETARIVAWSLAWSAGSSFVTNVVLGWPLWPRLIVGIAVSATAIWTTREHSLRWRFLMLRHWSRLNTLILDEDGRVRASLMPFETLHMEGDEQGPLNAHIHSRTLVLGRPRVRARATWREPS